MSTDAHATSSPDVTDADSAVETPGVAEGLDVALFVDGALAEEITTENCTLNGGAETTCYSITIAGYPASHDVGPFCPDTITDSADAGGIWFDGDGVYDLDGEFIATLSVLYCDDTWKMYDDDGNVLVTETAEEFEAAARPDVDPDLQNHCVEGRLEWLDDETEEFGEIYHYHYTYDSPNLPACRVGAAASGKLTSPDNSAAALPDGDGPPGG